MKVKMDEWSVKISYLKEDQDRQKILDSILAWVRTQMREKVKVNFCGPHLTNISISPNLNRLAYYSLGHEPFYMSSDFSKNPNLVISLENTGKTQEYEGRIELRDDGSYYLVTNAWQLNRVNELKLQGYKSNEGEKC
jgi:hypothetical protein